jgi:hypothetical protein
VGLCDAGCVLNQVPSATACCWPSSDSGTSTSRVSARSSGHALIRLCPERRYPHFGHGEQARYDQAISD